ncbi:MAG: tyrosine--tRNA ligase [Anaerolineaceae bacterium]|nr:tyrosine--tRNA ligase [Anaerolineae bacterium]MDL1925728.1 tyrosine--tRNA ligase [Anaerolineae bacterium AMX1]WKZ55683.1 MAG: tyrosine--tRNA ligase [Anaerolineales bacterium]GIK09513.1 MAG: tyrosine--tRNA ligase [Chloroflexota bacterium]GJQ38648.1 MAG: tyrosine--tRNA ligase [Anaerolineaceae bacterium]
MNIEEQVELLMQGTEYGDEDLKKAMTADLRERLLSAQKEGRPLRVYCGYDPTSTDLHLGHTITMRKLRQFQDLGHEATFLIGSYTALVGDPSDKNKARPILTEEQVMDNARTYAEQAFRVLDRQKTVIRYNGEWLSKLTLVDLIRLGQNFTVQQFLARDNFSNRLEKGEPIFLHETFYALMQGYDAVAMQTDVQVGGTDQLFNIIVAGRKLQEALGQKPLVGIICGILPGTDGVQRMSKSTGNVVPINTDAADMYGKVMSIPDSAMGLYYRLATRFGPHEIDAVEKSLADGTLHPRDAKMRLAREIAAIFHGEAEADAAQANFVRTFQQRETPVEMEEYAFKPGQTVLDVLMDAGLAESKSKARALIDQKGVRLDGKTLERGDVPFPHAGVLQVGKRRFVRVR